MDDKSQPLSDAYHKARRSYCLFSGLLIAWELIGIELPKDPFPQVKIILKSPEATPFVFIALVFFFSFRMTIEFFQCDEKRIKNQYSKIDFFGAHSLGVISIGIYLIQRLLEIQLADILNYRSIPSLFLGLSLSYTIYKIIKEIYDSLYAKTINEKSASIKNRLQQLNDEVESTSDSKQKCEEKSVYFEKIKSDFERLHTYRFYNILNKKYSNEIKDDYAEIKDDYARVYSYDRIILYLILICIPLFLILVLKEFDYLVSIFSFALLSIAFLIHTVSERGKRSHLLQFINKIERDIKNLKDNKEDRLF